MQKHARYLGRIFGSTPSVDAASRARDAEKALDDLYGEYADTVERWVQRLAGPEADVEDLLHDVFVVALRRWKEFRGDASVRTWLFRITQKVVAGRRRRDHLRRILLVRHAQDLIDGTPGTPSDEIEQRQRTARLYQALDRLPDHHRTPLVLYEIEGLSGQEVATLLGIQVNALWVRLHRARAKLLTALGEVKQR